MHHLDPKTREQKSIQTKWTQKRRPEKVRKQPSRTLSMTLQTHRGITRDQCTSWNFCLRCEQVRMGVIRWPYVGRDMAKWGNKHLAPCHLCGVMGSLCQNIGASARSPLVLPSAILKLPSLFFRQPFERSLLLVLPSASPKVLLRGVISVLSVLLSHNISCDTVMWWTAQKPLYPLCKSGIPITQFLW